ncbi:MAG TPA: hypothetical protein VKB67_09785 [Rhizomicrobium sp.]|nr:hypothetical protein [Rhizomicrobium sp.]
MPELTAWDSFYVIAGSAAGALIGLQFVVMTLLADSPTLPNPLAGAAFGSPTVVHFSAVLLMAALLRVPWTGLWEPALVLGALGVAGMVYAGVVARRMATQGAYRPDPEDWLFHVLFPLLAYGLLAVSGAEMLSHLEGALFGLGTAALLLLFGGIHNAWDAVAYHVFVVKRNARKPPE